MTKTRIMVVEDESMVLEYINNNLHSLGYAVVANATSGEEAIEKSKVCNPNLILMDIRLKGKVDGIEAADYIRKNFKIPTVYLTSYSDDKTLERAKLTVPLGYLMKPFEKSELKSAIEIAIYKHKMDRKLLESENKFRSIFENSLDTIYISSKDGKILDINSIATKFLGYSIKEFLKLNIKQLFIKPSQRRIYQSSLDKNGYVKDFEVDMQKKDQTPVVGLASATVIKNEKDEIIGHQGIIRDITEKKRLEEQLLQAVKMGAIGRLASGIAHDFNNLLTIIIGYTETLFKYISDYEAKKNVDKVLTAGEKAAQLIKKILAFSRKQESYPIIVNVNTVIMDLETMIKRIIGENIEVKKNLFSDLGNIHIDAAHLEQIIMNIIVNARDAMPNGGRLTIKTRNFVFDDEFVKNHAGAKTGDFVEFSFTDTGVGMSRSIIDKIFEPFFTTKKREEGTGLGLATVYGIVKQNYGYIYANSELGKGTAFRVFFPKISQTADSKKKKVKTKKDFKFNDLTVILVEDEKSVQDLAKSILESLGFHVFALQNGEEAIKTAELYKERIDLLFTDIILPGISGKVVAKRMAELHPEIKVIFSSGYPHEYLKRVGLDMKKVNFIKKPYFKEKLLNKIKDVLKN